ncbi:glycosyltransferase family 4 protein [Mucilaginibacter agri]|uniref:Glycosyltransferase n=1 Tax=Mucilaginibacter agri TaxID=2695265 RepID=A0A965ZJQ2_9SPHI|nr:glycosyltransferase family 1 protein [Mucilaginibacter agri]NCD72405.1 glycosyltransferase [Mucilaginibacter agri]
MIVINGKFLNQRTTGVQRYALELTKQLLKSDLDVIVLVPKNTNLNNVQLPLAKIKRIGSFSNLNLWEQIDLPLYLKRNPKLLLIGFCNSGPWFHRRQIVCIHDMSYHNHPEWFTRSFYNYYKLLIPQLAKIALHIITVSEFSKQELITKLGLPESKISVIYNAPAKIFIADNFESISNQKEDFFLFVGSHDKRKNIKLLIDVFSLSAFRKYQLVIIGASSHSFPEHQLVEAPNITYISNCDDKDLANYYRTARALINASFYEGFGLPVIEAMASGCPIILSDIPPFKEITQHNAFYFNPHLSLTLMKAIEEFTNTPPSELYLTIYKNYKLSFSYNWESSSKSLISIMRRFIQ